MSIRSTSRRAIGNLFENLVEQAIEDLLPGWLPGWVKDLLMALLQPVVDIVKAVLDVFDSVEDFLQDLIGEKLDLLGQIETAVADYFANKYPIREFEDPYPILTDGPLIPVKISAAQPQGGRELQGNDCYGRYWLAMSKLYIDPNITQTGLDSGALTMLGAVVRRFEEPGEYRGTVRRGDAIEKVFYLSVDKESPVAAADIDLAKLAGSLPQQEEAGRDCCPGEGEARFSVNPRGYVLFRVSGGRGGYSVNLRRADPDEKTPVFNSTRTRWRRELLGARVATRAPIR